MKQKDYRGEWVSCSDLKERREELSKAHEEFQKLLDSGYQMKEARVKRPRIKRERQPRQVVVTLGGTWTMKMTFEEHKQRGDGLRIVMNIY